MSQSAEDRARAALTEAIRSGSTKLGKALRGDPEARKAAEALIKGSGGQKRTKVPPTGAPRPTVPTLA